MSEDPSARPHVRFVHDGEGRRIAWAEHGEGPTLVCPAWWVSHVEREWEEPPFRRFFAALGERFRVVRYDRVGVGLSDRAIGSPDLERELATLERVVDATGAERVHLLGVSMGGPVAVAYAARHPARVARLAFVGSFLRGADLATPEVAAAMVALVRAHWGLGSRALSDVFLPDAPRETLDRYLAKQRTACDGTAAARLLELAYTLDASAEALAVRAPALVVHRRGDRAIRAEAGRRLAAAIEGASMLTLEGAIHPPWEGPADVLDAVLAFLTRGELRGSSPAGCVLDEAACELDVDGTRVPLTKLELGLLAYLRARPGRVVSRAELLRAVWGQEHGGSNVVDAVVRGVRKKLGNYAASVETVVGHGYRFERFRR